MKKILIVFSLLLLAIPTVLGQTREFTLKSSADYSPFVLITSDKSQQWQLVGIQHNDYFTGLFFQITIANRDDGGFSFPENIYISGPFGTMNPIGLMVMDKDWPLGKIWRYDTGNRGKRFQVLLLFNRIPAGVETIDYCQPGFIEWTYIPVGDNPDPVLHTTWTDATLRSHWESTPCSSIEGIYYFTNASDKKWWGPYKHTLGVIKSGYQYDIIYLKGSNKGIWTEGDLKGSFIATATPGLYKATVWYMENRLENEDFYLQFTEGHMSIYENTASVSADFLKLFPANDINETGGNFTSPSQSSPSPSKPSAAATKSGSGIFVGSKIIATNNHVIDKAKKIEVSIKTGNDIFTYEARVLASDKVNDLALLIIEDDKFAGLGAMPYELTGRTRDVGTSVFTMGYPMASYMGEEVKITDGIISSKTGYEGDIVTYQISAPIQPGSSGGPLFDKKGTLIGITNAGIIAAQNVGYAIKSSYLCNLIESSPISIIIPEDNLLIDKELPEQIKILSKYVVFIKVY